MTRLMRSRRALLSALGSVAALAALTTGMIVARPWLDRVHVALCYLLLVLAVSTVAGRVIGSAVAAVAFGAFNFFFIPPYHTLAIGSAADWIVLVAFLATGLVSAQLLHVAKREAALREANRVKDEVLASVSHDLRTPLTSIRGLAQAIFDDGDHRAETIIGETDRLTGFVTDLLDLSRLRAGGLPMRCDINAADDLLGAALQQTSGLAGARRIVAAVDTSEPVLAGRFDFTHALRILVNLLANAIEHTPPTSAVELGARRDGAWLTFTVADRGAGIPPAVRDRLFTPFAGDRSPTTSAAQRTGLGLAIAQALAIAQGGTLAYAPRDGGGSVFTLRLPAVDVSRDLGD